MINIQIEPRQFEYDIQSLVQAFYPGQPFQINSEAQQADRVLKVVFSQQEIYAVLSDKKGELFRGQKMCIRDSKKS